MRLHLLNGDDDLSNLSDIVGQYDGFNPLVPFENREVVVDASHHDSATLDQNTISMGAFQYTWAASEDVFSNSINLSSDVGSVYFTEVGKDAGWDYNYTEPGNTVYGGHNESTTVSVLSASVATPDPTWVGSVDYVYGYKADKTMPSLVPNNFLWAVDVKQTSNDYQGHNQADGSFDFSSATHVDDNLYGIRLGPQGYAFFDTHTVTDVYQSASHNASLGLDMHDYHSVVTVDQHIVGHDYHLIA